MNNTSGSSFTWGNSRRNRSACHQCVVAGRSSSRPAAASTNAPVQIDMIRAPRSWAAVSAAVTAGTGTPSRSVGPPWMPATITVSASSVASSPWSGSTWKPADERTGRPSGVQVVTV